jgi:hypothetical protein
VNFTATDPDGDLRAVAVSIFSARAVDTSP